MDLDTVNNHSAEIDKYVDQIVEPITKELTAYINNLHKIVASDNSDLTTTELSQSILFISTSMYALVNDISKSAIRQSIAEMVKDNKYNEAYMSQTTGTISDKKANAEMAINEQQLVELIYKTAYNKLKMLYDSADSCLGSVKKIMNLRVSEQQLTMKVG